MFKVFSKRHSTPNAGGLIYELPQPLRMQVIRIWDEVASSITEIMVQRSLNLDIFYGVAHKHVCDELGTFQLMEGSRSAREDLCNYFLNQEDTGKCLDVIEIVFACFAEWGKDDFRGTNWHLRDEIYKAVQVLNQRFQEHSVGFEFQNGHFTRIDSQFLHAEAVTPALELLRQSYLSGANQEFARAQEHLRHGLLAESMNECLKALESTMKCICDKRGWTYSQTDTASKLLNVCVANNLFPTYMQTSLNGLRSVLENVATFRNKQSGHGQGVQQVNIDRDTAAFVLNSTATNILFLASCEKKLP